MVRLMLILYFFAGQNWLDVFIVSMSILDLTLASIPSWLVPPLQLEATLRNLTAISLNYICVWPMLCW